MLGLNNIYFTKRESECIEVTAVQMFINANAKPLECYRARNPILAIPAEKWLRLFATKSIFQSRVQEDRLQDITIGYWIVTIHASSKSYTKDVAYMSRNNSIGSFKQLKCPYIRS